MENQRVILLRDQRHEFDKRSHILRKCSSASEHESFSGMTSFYSCFFSARHERGQGAFMKRSGIGFETQINLRVTTN